VSSLADPTPEGKSIVKLAREQGLQAIEPENAEFIAFNASTRISGVNLENGQQIRKGA
jgi:K+-transporting ATPase ATPase B chain